MVSDEDPKKLILVYLRKNRGKKFTNPYLREKLNISKGEIYNATRQLLKRKLIIAERYYGKRLKYSVK